MDLAQGRLVRGLWWGNLITFAVLSAGALVLFTPYVALSLMVGGVIALINFRLLQASVNRALLLGKRAAVGTTLLKYYLRFAATALVIFILVRQGLVEPLGLLVGLSVVVITIFVWTLGQALKLAKQTA